jgi:hypothetical protein
VDVQYIRSSNSASRLPLQNSRTPASRQSLYPQSTVFDHLYTFAMQLDISLLLAFVGLLSSTAAAPGPASDAEPARPRPCIVPEVFFTSLEKPFTLDALVPGRSNSTHQASWPVQLSPHTPTKKVISVPVISHTRIAQPKFRLVNQTLLSVNGGFPARRGSTIEPFPLPPQPFEFGGREGVESGEMFGAVYSCDSTGRQILKLVPGEGNLLPIVFFSLHILSVSCSLTTLLSPSNPFPEPSYIPELLAPGCIRV